MKLSKTASRAKHSAGPPIGLGAAAAHPRARKAAPRKRGSVDNTRDKILDSAEALFGQRTFDTVSLRDITQHADVTLALASYHFGTKDRLYAEVVERRADLLNAMRRERLAAVEARGALSTEKIIDAFMSPLFEQMKDGPEGWQAYMLILSNLAQTNRWLDLLHKNFDATAEIFLGKLAKTLPKVPRPLLMRGFSLTLVAMLQTVAKNRRVDSLSGGRVSADDLNAAYRTLLKFVVRGLEGLGELS
jgi:AcrR family transcriptional regulator